LNITADNIVTGGMPIRTEISCPIQKKDMWIQMRRGCPFSSTRTCRMKMK
jgi:hypothetical protein